MIIRNVQMQQFSKTALRTFEDEMVAHLAEFSPPLFQVIKDEQMREAVRFGIRRANEYEFSFRGPIRLYLELMLLFGSYFDTDPQYVWASEILKDRNANSQMQRAEQLYEKTLEYQEKVSGQDAENNRRALNELLIMARQPTKISPTNFATDMYGELKRIFPQKAEYTGQDNLMQIIQKGEAQAESYRFPTVRGKVLIVSLMFGFGHGFSDDPLYPWISRTIKDERIIDPAARAERLEKKAITWLEHVLTGQGEDKV